MSLRLIQGGLILKDESKLSRLARLRRIYKLGEARMQANLLFSELMTIEPRVVKRFWQIDSLLNTMAEEISKIQTKRDQ